MSGSTYVSIYEKGCKALFVLNIEDGGDNFLRTILNVIGLHSVKIVEDNDHRPFKVYSSNADSIVRTKII